MTLRARFFLNLFAPPTIASLFFAVSFCVAGRSFEPLLGLPIILLVACFYAGLPSLAHACVLAIAYRRGLAPESRRALALSSLNGLLAGALIGLLIAAQSGGRDFTFGLILLPIGAATGAINALLHRLPRRRTTSGTTGA